VKFSFQERNRSLQHLRENPKIELLVVGGGVVGASIAAHAANLGLEVALIEKEDFASGTSGQSTGLAHAGFRYLAQGRFWYVFKESREVQRLLSLAPHLVRPFDFCLPVYRGDPYPFWAIRLATWIYSGLSWLTSAISGYQKQRSPAVLSPQELLKRFPELNPEGLKGAAEYFVDARVIDTRFSLELARSAAEAGAHILPYVKMTNIGNHVRCRDMISAVDFDLSPRLVVNATGPWIDEIRSLWGYPDPSMTLSQGIHLIVDRVADTPLIFSTDIPGQVFLVLPYGSDVSLIGTTETPLVHPGEAGPREDEIEHLLRHLLRRFPHLGNDQAAYSRDHVRHVFWGTRPLLKQSGNTLLASREYALIKEESLWSVPGVKLTAGRVAGEEVAAEAWRFLRKSSPPHKRLTGLPGGNFDSFGSFVKQSSEKFPELSRAALYYFSGIYGTDFEDVMLLGKNEPALSEKVLMEEPWIWAEAVYAARNEMALTLEDFLFRRTRWARGRILPKLVIERAADLLGRELGWDAEEKKRQLEQYSETLKKHSISSCCHSRNQ
jgi:glycerol-3-phosphate dehydrogenase